MLKRKTLKFKNIGRFVSLQEIDFENYGNIVQIDGLNLNSGGSSGSGKSTLIEVTNINLGISKIPSTIYQSRFTKEPAWTQGVYEKDNTTYTITREAGKSLTVSWEGETNGEITGNNPEAENKIQSLLGLEPELYRKMTHKAQKEDGFFLSLTPSQSFSFLLKTLKMEEMLNKLSKIDEIISNKDKKYQDSETTLKYQREMVASQELSLASLEALVLENLPDLSPLQEKEAEILEKETELNKIKENLEKGSTILRKKLEDELSTLVKPDRPERAPSDPALVELSLEIKNLEEKLKEIESSQQIKINKTKKIRNEVLKEINSIGTILYNMPMKEQALIDLEDELSHLSKGQCSTCLQSWTDENLALKIKDLELKKQNLEKDIALKPDLENQLEKENANLARIESILEKQAQNSESNEIKEKISSLKFTFAKIENEDKAKAQEINSSYLLSLKEVEKEEFSIKLKYNNKIDSLRESLNSSISSLTEEIYSLRRGISRAKEAYQTIELEHKLHQGKIQQAKESLNLYKDKLNKALILNAEYSQDLLASQETKRFLKSYTNKKFEEALEAISLSATERLNAIPNMTTASIAFEAFKEVKGKIKEEVTPVLSMDGEVGVPLKSLSGGERSAADLAIDLAVADFIETNSGMGADYIVLDEPCAGMDIPGKQAYLEMLKLMNGTKQIFIVEHSTEIKDMVDDIIMVERNGLESKILNN